jgi:hypothetical protein
MRGKMCRKLREFLDSIFSFQIPIFKENSNLNFIGKSAISRTSHGIELFFFPQSINLRKKYEKKKNA